MSKPLINELSSQQKIVFPDYLYKWQAIATKTQAINKEKAEAAIKNAYKIMNYGEPGTRVRLPSTGEYGIVVHCWYG